MQQKTRISKLVEHGFFLPLFFVEDIVTAVVDERQEGGSLTTTTREERPVNETTDEKTSISTALVELG